MDTVVKHTEDRQYDLLIQQISSLVSNAKKQAATAINSMLVETYRNTGKYIVEFEQEGNARAKYGDRLLINPICQIWTNFAIRFSNRLNEYTLN
jgi:hypothetical protein